jgi:hypothetical protein
MDDRARAARRYQRIAHLICEMALRAKAVGLEESGSFEFPVTQAELGDALGLSNVHVNRVIMELRKNGLITMRNSTVTFWTGRASSGPAISTPLPPSGRSTCCVTLILQPVQVETGGPDEEGSLAFVDGRLAAVLVRLSDQHGDRAGHWFVEAGFGPFNGPNHPTFSPTSIAASSGSWIAPQAGRALAADAPTRKRGADLVAPALSQGPAPG